MVLEHKGIDALRLQPLGDTDTFYFHVEPRITTTWADNNRGVRIVGAIRQIGREAWFGSKESRAKERKQYN